MLVTLFVVLIPFLITAKYIESNTRIVNGDPISSDQYPWMVSLRAVMTTIFENGTNQTQELQFCGASLIAVSPPTILTAAHCLDGIFSYSTNTTLLGPFFADINRTYDIANTPNDTYYTLPIYQQNIHIHPKWNMSRLFNGYDIALYISNESLSISAQHKLQPYLPTISTDTPCCKPNEDLTIIGYGTMWTGGDSSPVLRTTNMNYMDSMNCSQQLFQILSDAILINGSLPQNLTAYNSEGFNFTNDTTIDQFNVILARYVINSAVYDDRVVCIIGNNTDACHGDSGGPLFKAAESIYEIELIGATSFGPDGQCNSGTFTGYTSVASYHQWINNMTGMNVTNDDLSNGSFHHWGDVKLMESKAGHYPL